MAIEENLKAQFIALYDHVCEKNPGMFGRPPFENPEGLKELIQKYVAAGKEQELSANITTLTNRILGHADPSIAIARSMDIEKLKKLVDSVAADEKEEAKKQKILALGTELIKIHGLVDETQFNNDNNIEYIRQKLNKHPKNEYFDFCCTMAGFAMDGAINIIKDDTVQEAVIGWLLQTAAAEDRRLNINRKFSKNKPLITFGWFGQKSKKKPEITTNKTSTGACCPT